MTMIATQAGMARNGHQADERCRRHDLIDQRVHQLAEIRHQGVAPGDFAVEIIGGRREHEKINASV